MRDQVEDEKHIPQRGKQDVLHWVPEWVQVESGEGITQGMSFYSSDETLTGVSRRCGNN